MADIENQVPVSETSSTNPVKPTTGSNQKLKPKHGSSDRKKLQTLQPSGKNQTLLVSFKIKGFVLFKF